MSAIYSLLVITDTILNRVTLNWKRGKRTHVFLDEFHVVFENEQSGVFFNSAWRQFRKRGAYPTAITQNVEYLLTPCRPTPSQGVPWFQERGLWQDNSYEPRPGDIIFSIGMMAARMVLPTMLVSWRRWRMAASTLSRVTPAIAAVKTVTRLVTMKSMGTEPRRIN